MRNGRLVRKEIIKPVRQFWIVRALVNTSYQELLTPHLYNVGYYWAYHGQYYISNWVLDNHLVELEILWVMIASELLTSMVWVGSWSALRNILQNVIDKAHQGLMTRRFLFTLWLKNRHAAWAQGKDTDLRYVQYFFNFFWSSIPISFKGT